MNAGKTASGQCLCGKVEITVSQINNQVGACHCGMCRRWGGGPFFAIECSDAVKVKGEEHITVYPSSDWAERGFCKYCGTHLFYRLRQNDFHVIPAGLLNIDADLVFDHQVFIDEKPAFYDFANKTQNMTGEEVFARFT